MFGCKVCLENTPAAGTGISRSLEKAAAGGWGERLVMIVLPTVAVMRMVVIENKGYNLA